MQQETTRDDSDSLLMTAAEVAAELRLSTEQVYRLCREGELPSIKVGSNRRIPRAALLAWISEQAKAA
jgi:excisionase family DNA binding protein